MCCRQWAGDCEAICREGPNLLEQKFDSQTPNTVWLADITYIDTPSRDIAAQYPAG
jgi:transposase InsO family protein